MSRPWWFAIAAIVSTGACDEPNEAPFACGHTPLQTVDMGDSVSFVPCFADPNGDALTLSAEVATHENPPPATATVSGETVTIHGTLEHRLLFLAVTATDPGGLHAEQEVEVTVRSLHDLTVLRAWPDTQTVRDDHFELHFVIGNVGSTNSTLSTWSVRASNDSVITAADPVLEGDYHVHIRNMAPGDTLDMRSRYQDWPDPGKPFFGMCGVSETPEYNLENNCSKGLRVVFPDSMTRGSRGPSSVWYGSCAAPCRTTPRGGFPPRPLFSSPPDPPPADTIRADTDEIRARSIR